MTSHLTRSMVFNLMQMAHANLCISISISMDNVALVLLSVTVLHLFIANKRNSRLQSQGFEEQNDAGQLSNSDLLGDCMATPEIMNTVVQISQRANRFSMLSTALFFDKHLLHPCMVSGLCFDDSAIKRTYLLT